MDSAPYVARASLKSLPHTTRTSFAFKKPRCKKDSLTSPSLATSLTGATLKRKAIQALPSTPNTLPFPLHTDYHKTSSSHFPIKIGWT